VRWTWPLLFSLACGPRPAAPERPRIVVTPAAAEPVVSPPAAVVEAPAIETPRSHPGLAPDDPVLALDPLTAPGSVSTSIGGPNDGHLSGALPLPLDAPGLHSNPRRPNETAYWGTVELVRMLVAAAAVVERELPGGTLTVNDLGFREGGDIPHHGSHTAGRDVDVLFYLLDAPAGAPRPGIGAPLDPGGMGTDFGDLVDPEDDVDVWLDVPRTWRFVQAILEDEEALVQRIFVVEHLRSILLAHAEANGAPEAVRARFAEVTCQPSYPHDDHLHVRLFCTDEDLGAGCADGPPMYPWRRAQLRAAGLAPVFAERARRGESPPAEAAEEPPMHERVRAFLELRRSWERAPHPGRPFCR
jgi:penicillin-insensitive murein endopeptidase